MFRIVLLCVTYIISLSLVCVLVCDIYHFTIWHERPARYLTNSRLEITRWTCFGTQTHNSHILIKWKPHTATFTTLNPSQIRRPQNGSTTQKNAKWSIQLGSNRNMFLLKSSCGTFQTHNLSKFIFQGASGRSSSNRISTTPAQLSLFQRLILVSQNQGGSTPFMAIKMILIRWWVFP